MKPYLRNTIILLCSIIGLSGGILIPVFGVTLFWMNKIDSWLYFDFFIIFAILNLLAILLMRTISKEEKFRRYALFLSVVGLCINGFWIITGLPGALY